MMQQHARDEAGNIWEVDAQGNPVRLVQAAGSAAPGPVQLSGPDPSLALDRTAKQLAIQQAMRAAARAPGEEARAQDKADREKLEWTATHNADGSPKPTASKNGSAELTAATRANAINAFTATRQLDSLISDIESKYRAGPGSTKGLSGVQDWLPTPSNKRFNSAGDAVRGAAITALGFTSGQTNTPREVEQNIGPYIPAAGDYDQVIEDKIARLKELRDRARVQAVTVLGGVPSADGRITPLSQVPQQDRDKLFPPGTMQPTSGGGGGAPPSAGSSAAPTTGGTGGGSPGSPGVDRSTTYVLGPDDSPGGVNVPTGKTITKDNPALAGVNAKLAGMWQNGTPYEQIKQYMRSVGLDPAKGNAAELEAFRLKNPGYKGKFSVNVDDVQVPMSRAQQIFNKVGTGPVGAAMISAANTVVPLDRLTAKPEVTRAIMAGVEQNHPTASLVGTVGGGAIGAGAVETSLGRLATTRLLAAAPRLARAVANPVTADAAFGAGQGAMRGDGAGGVVLDALAGAGGGTIGRTATRGVAGAAGGVRNAAIDELQTRGIPMTVGQALSQSGRLGRTAKSIEDAMTSLPVVGNMINARRLEGLRGMNRSAFNEALEPVGQTIAGNIGEEGVEEAGGLVSGAYNDATAGVRIAGDNPFVGDMRGVFQNAGRLPATMADNARYTLNTRVGEAFDPNGEMTGSAFQQALRGLRRDASAVRPQPFGHDFGNVTRQAETALEGLATRQAPDIVPGLRRANEAYGRTGIVRDAVNAARGGSGSGEGGVFTAAQLANAASKNARRFGGTHATPDQPFYALTNAARDVLPSRIPDSGTAGRLMLGTALAGGAGGADYAAGGSGSVSASTAGTLALLSLLGTRRGQQALVAGLTRRPDALRTAADAIARNQRWGGVLGAGATVPLLTGP